MLTRREGGEGERWDILPTDMQKVDEAQSKTMKNVTSYDTEDMVEVVFPVDRHDALPLICLPIWRQKV